MGLRLSEETDMPNSSNETAEGFSEDNTDMAELPNQIDIALALTTEAMIK